MGVPSDQIYQPQIEHARNYIIGSAHWRDLNSLRALEQVCFPEDAWPLIDLIGVLTLPNIVRLKAVVNTRMVGFIAGDPRPWEGVGWITTLGVDPHFRNRGIGHALLEECEERLSLPRIRLTVRRSNVAAIQLYARAGYHQVDTWTRYYQGEEDGLVLEKSRQDT